MLNEVVYLYLILFLPLVGFFAATFFAFFAALAAMVLRLDGLR